MNINTMKRREYDRIYYQRNKEKIKERVKNYINNNREKYIYYHKKYRQENPEDQRDVTARVKKWRRLNKERAKEMSRKQLMSEVSTCKFQYRKLVHRSKERNLELNIDYKSYCSLIKNAVCHYCGGKLPKYGPGLDRKNNSLGYIVGNIVPCCFNCNTMKGSNLTYDEMQLIWNMRRMKKYKHEI